jgi:LPXTG-site transpeptidase (sortase) family protein
MEKKRGKGIKILLSVLLPLVVIIPSLVFIIYPKYTDIKILVNSTDILEITKNSWTSFLISISPPIKDVRGEMTTTADSIEETTSNLQPLEEYILEDLNTSLLIPSIDVEGIVVEGISSDNMNRGFWHFPSSEYPGEKGNCVIIGHRFEYLPPAKNTFYNLDKVNIGDSIVIKESEDIFTYIVTNIEVVEKNDISILKDTSDYRLTLVTCTPLWTSKQRLVITAKMDRIYNRG